MSVKTNKLQNLGSTCYLNSVIQMIYHIKELRDFILNTNFDDNYRYYHTFNRINTDINKKVNDIQVLTSEQKNFLNSIKQIIIEYNNNNSILIDFRKLYILKSDKSVIEHIYIYLKTKMNFTIGSQQDSSEIVVYIFELLLDIRNMELIKKIYYYDKVTLFCSISTFTRSSLKYQSNVQLTLPDATKGTVLVLNDLLKEFSKKEEIDLKDPYCKDLSNIDNDVFNMKSTEIFSPSLHKYLFIRTTRDRYDGGVIQNFIKFEKYILNNTFKIKICLENSGINGENGKTRGHYLCYLFDDSNKYIILSDDSEPIIYNISNTFSLQGVLYVYERIDYVPDKLEQSMKELQEQVKDDPILKSYQDYLIKEHEKFMKS
jgi:hypothetical protein